MSFETRHKNVQRRKPEDVYIGHPALFSSWQITIPNIPKGFYSINMTGMISGTYNEQSTTFWNFYYGTHNAATAAAAFPRPGSESEYWSWASDHKAGESISLSKLGTRYVDFSTDGDDFIISTTHFYGPGWLWTQGRPHILDWRVILTKMIGD